MDLDSDSFTKTLKFTHNASTSIVKDNQPLIRSHDRNCFTSNVHYNLTFKKGSNNWSRDKDQTYWYISSFWGRAKSPQYNFTQSYITSQTRCIQAVDD